jgi:flavin reductase (DIM6/NTAB) family NADH-FMN oxidoreductase RutF
MVMVADLSDIKQQTGKALGRLASGVYVITWQQNKERHGILATWVMQAGFEPPAITAAFNKQRPMLKKLAKGTVFTVNVLSNRTMDVFKAFAKPSEGEHDDRFNGLDVMDNKDGGPIFVDAVAYLNCKVTAFLEGSDHTIALAEVVSGKLMNPEDQPMVHFRNNGFQY